jgi:hypothetical protein
MRNTNNTRIDVLTVKRVCHAIPIESNLFADFYRYKQAIGIHFTSVYKWVKTNHFLKIKLNLKGYNNFDYFYLES